VASRQAKQQKQQKPNPAAPETVAPGLPVRPQTHGQAVIREELLPTAGPFSPVTQDGFLHLDQEIDVARDGWVTIPLYGIRLQVRLDPTGKEAHYEAKDGLVILKLEAASAEATFIYEVFHLAKPFLTCKVVIALADKGGGNGFAIRYKTYVKYDIAAPIEKVIKPELAKSLEDQIQLHWKRSEPEQMAEQSEQIDLETRQLAVLERLAGTLERIEKKLDQEDDGERASQEEFEVILDSLDPGLFDDVVWSCES
jgi:hypothetical protein